MARVQIEEAVKHRVAIEIIKDMTAIVPARTAVGVTKFACVNTPSWYALCAGKWASDHFRIRPNEVMLDRIGHAVAEHLEQRAAEEAAIEAACVEMVASRPTLN
jgi:hypothetical protein